MRASSPIASYGATNLEQRLAVESSGTAVTLERARVTQAEGGACSLSLSSIGMVVEGESLVEFGERNREADFGEGERIVVLEHEDVPSVLGADMDGGADPGLLEHDIALDRGRRLILARLDDSVRGGGARAQHLKDHNGVIGRS